LIIIYPENIFNVLAQFLLYFYNIYFLKAKISNNTALTRLAVNPTMDIIPNIAFPISLKPTVSTVKASTKLYIPKARVNTQGIYLIYLRFLKKICSKRVITANIAAVPARRSINLVSIICKFICKHLVKVGYLCRLLRCFIILIPGGKALLPRRSTQIYFYIVAYSTDIGKLKILPLKKALG